MNNKILISFIGGTDIRKENSAIAQLIQVKNPDKIYLFLTKEFEKIVEEHGLIQKYKTMTKAPVIVEKTEIENPSDQKEIYEKISQKLNLIKTEICVNNDIGLINLTSGTPDIKCVFSILLATGYFPAKRFWGIYAPNPEYDNKIRLDDLKFYKQTLSGNTIKLLIDNSEYPALYEYITTDNISKMMDLKNEFIQLSEFAYNRFICNFKKAQEIYNNNDFAFEYKMPANIYEKSVEVYNSVEKIIKQKDYFQSTLKLGIIRENLLKYINEIYLGGYEKIADESTDEKKKGVYYLSEEKLDKNYPQLKQYMLESQKKTKESKNQELRFGEINSHVDFLIFSYFEETKQTGMMYHFHCLEELKKHRNDLAHTLTVPKENAEKWAKHIKNILVLISENFDVNFLETNFYDELNTELKKLL